MKAYWADYLRVIATISVIILHVSGPILYKYGSIPASWWNVGNITDSAMRFAVPIFLMLSGALLLPKDYSLGDFLKKRFVRIIYPFLFWSAIYIGYKVIFENNALTVSYVLTQLRDGAYYHLWYVYVLVGLYLFMPILGKWIRNCTEKEILYFLAIWILVLLLDMKDLSPFKPKIEWRYFSGYIGFPVLGYYLSTKSFPKEIIYIAICLFVGGVVFTAVGTQTLSAQAGRFVQDYYAYLMPNVIVAAIGMFLFVKQFYLSKQETNKTVQVIGKYSFGIYLSHPLVLKLMGEYAGIDSFMCTPFVGILVTTILALLVSSVISFLIHKIPFVGKHLL